MALISVLALPARAQVAQQIPDQQAGATEWFGDRVLRVRGGNRVDIEPRVAAHAAVLQMQPGGALQVVRVTTVTPDRQGFDVARPEIQGSSGTIRVPFVVAGTSGADAMAAAARRPPPPPPSAIARFARDGILVILADVPLDSADLTARLGLLPALEADSVASHVGQLLIGRRTAMWATYFQRR
jgi:hypothetical protein